jgi:hypothetical protein
MAKAPDLQRGCVRVGGVNNLGKLEEFVHGMCTTMDVTKKAHNSGVQDMDKEDRANDARREVMGRIQGSQGRVEKVPSINPPEDHPEDIRGDMHDGRYGRGYTGRASRMTENGGEDNQTKARSEQIEREDERKNQQRSTKNKTPLLRSETADVDTDNNHLTKKTKSAEIVEIIAKGMITQTLGIYQTKQDRLKDRLRRGCL